MITDLFLFGEMRVIKFNFDCNSSNQIHYLNYNPNQPKYKKQLHIQKLLEQKNAPLCPTVSSRHSSLGVRVKALDRSRSSERIAVENFIRDKYRAVHEASISEFFPTLFAGYVEQEMQVAIGLEHLKTNAAFLEQYLDEPIEMILGKLGNTRVARERIVEIGNLAALNMDHAKLMVAFLVFHLTQKNIEWAVCTGTAAVRYVLQQMGLHFHVLDKANPELLGEAKRQWGSYYQQKPYVLAIHVAEALAVTKELYSFKG